MRKKRKVFGTWYDAVVAELLTKDVARVTEFVNHAPIPDTQAERVRQLLISELKRIGAMAR